MNSDRLTRENERLRRQNAKLLSVIEELQSKLLEPEEIIQAIRQGEIDALVVEEKGQEQIYALQTFDSVYRSMVEECFPYGVWLAEPKGRLLYVSPSFLDLLKTDLREMREKGQFHFLPPETRDAVERLWAKHREMGSAFNVEYTVRFDDGSERTIWTHGVLAPTLSGQIHWVGVNIDVTEQNKIKNELRLRTEALQERTAELERANQVLQLKIVQHQQAEIALRESEERLRLAMEASATGLWDWDMRTDTVVWSPECYSIHGLREEDFDGTLAGFDRLLYAGDRERVWTAARTATDRRAKYECEFRIVRPDGEIRWVANLGRAIYDEQGHPLRMIGTIIDVTERKRADDAVKKQNKRFRLLSEAAAVLLVTHDPDTMLRRLFTKISPHLELDAYVNHMVDDGNTLRLASFVGFPEEALRLIERLELGQAALHRNPVAASHIQQANDSKSEIVKALGLRAYACHPLTAGNKLIGTLAFASRSKDRFDAEELEFLQTICRYVAVAYERMGLVNELRDADRRKDEFLAMLGHELRNPLAPIKSAVRVMKALAPSDPRNKQAQEIIDRQVAHLTRLVDDLLDVSRIVQGKITLKKAPLDLSTVLDHALEASKPIIQARKHELTVSVPDRPIRLEGDGVRLAQVISNLLNNAAKYTPEGGKIWLSATREDGQALIRIKDTGEGIPQPLLARIFGLFVQSERSLDRAQGGLGLGLAIVKRIVELHGGRIEARSDGVGKGSEFLVWLPAPA